MSIAGKRLAKRATSANPVAGAPSAFARAPMIERLRTERFDVLVVGGGITGVGTALDAASRGLRVALVERDDYASGTSSKSSKLVHGGLRYLQQGEIRLVYEALHERRRLCRNAPHLVRVLPFMIPVLTKDGVISRRIARALGTALWMYDLTGGWRIGKLHRRLRADEALAQVPTMPVERLRSAYLYYDATADDARLCLTVARTAAEHGAVVVNRAELVRVGHDERGRVESAVVRVDGEEITVQTRCVVNAGGVWSDEITRADQPPGHPAPSTIRPAKGVHISLPWELIRNEIAVVVPVPQDKRSLFVVPTGRRADGTYLHTYVGTTDTDYDGPLDAPRCTAADVDYVLRALNAAFTTKISAEDITGTWAGLRPLVASAASGATADLSRSHRVTTRDTGMITVTGGKLTTYREMAEDTVDAVLHWLRPDDRLVRLRHRCRTRRLPLFGAVGFRLHSSRPDLGRAHLEDRYGTAAVDVLALCEARPELAEPLIPGLPYLRAEAVYAAREEQATTLDDVLSRRTRALLFDRDAAAAAAPAVAELLAGELGWDEARCADEVERFRALCAAQAASEAGPLPVGA